MGCRVFLAFILSVCLLSHCQSNDEEYDVEGQLTQGLPHDVYVSLGTCQYNIPRCIVGEKSPPEAIGECCFCKVTPQLAHHYLRTISETVS
uniref:Secreted protein n=1 Tax=Oncorhynchus kisutch TaxID=8019 RepID=A0A8C7MLQ6_ONCKI